MIWSDFHCNLLSAYLTELNVNEIKYFILRNYEGLPESNSSKDVDIVVEPSKVEIASKLLKLTYKKFKLSNYYEVRFGVVRCVYGMNLKEKISIHIDLIPGYLPKGYEIFSFDEMYSNTITYKNFKVLNDTYNGIVLLVYKIFCYSKPVLNNTYRYEIRSSFQNNSDRFKVISKNIFGPKLGLEICHLIETNEFDKLLLLSTVITKKLRIFAFKKAPLKTFIRASNFIFEKLYRTVLACRFYSKSFAVNGDNNIVVNDFINRLNEELRYFYVRDNVTDICNLYSYPPSAILGKSSLNNIRRYFLKMCNKKILGNQSLFFYYLLFWIDGILGWWISIRNDVRCDFYSVFNNTINCIDSNKSNLLLTTPSLIKNFLSFLTPKPKLVFLLTLVKAQSDNDAKYHSLDEINCKESTNQVIENIFISNPFDSLSIDFAVSVIINKYTEKL